MKQQIHLSSRSEARRGNARSIVYQRGSAWAALLLAVCCAVLAGLAHPVRAAVTEAWVHRYNGPTDSDDQARAVVVDGGGNVVVTGGSASGFSVYGYPYYDYYTAKYAAADGGLLWEQRYNGPANLHDEALALAVDGSGNVVVTGIANTGFRLDGTMVGGDYYTAKYAAANGALLWEQRYAGPANDYDAARAVAVDGSGNVVVTGTSYGTNSNYDYYTAKYAAADGALLWEKRYTSGVAAAVAVDGSGNVLVTGSSGTIKYLPNGTEVWTNSTGATAIAVDGSGNVVVTGYSWNGTSTDYYTAKYAAVDGALLWEKRYNGPANSDDQAQALALDGGGNVVVTGNSYNTNDTSSDYYTVKYAAADGALFWEKRYNSPGNGDDQAKAVAVDGSGNVVVTGTSYNGNNYDYYTAKYAAADGALLWEKRYHGPANGYDFASSVALGPNGMVAVTGSSICFCGTSDYATVVYRENLPPVSIDLVPTGIRLRFTGVPGHSYNIERAPAVTGPWSTLATPTAPVGGLIEYVDTNAPVGTAFYRTSAP